MADKASLKNLKVIELRERLKTAGLSASGNKAELVDRLHNHLQSENQRQNNELKQMELLDQQQEALGFEQVRLLNQEKENELLAKAHQQHQMLEAEKQAQAEQQIIQINIEEQQKEERLLQIQQQALIEIDQQQQQTVILSPNQIVPPPQVSVPPPNVLLSAVIGANSLIPPPNLGQQPPPILPNTNLPPPNILPPPPLNLLGPTLVGMPPLPMDAGQFLDPSHLEAHKPPSLMSLNVPKPLEENPEEIELPHALEKALAYKDERAQQLGVDPNDSEPKMTVEQEHIPDSPAKSQPAAPKPLVAIDDDEDEGEIRPRESKNKRRKNKKKQRKARALKRLEQEKEDQRKREEEEKKKKSASEKSDRSSSKRDKNKENVSVEYVQEIFQPSDPIYFQFVRIFEKFKLHEPEKPKDNASELPLEGLKPLTRLAERKKPADVDEEDDDDEEENANKDDDKAKMSKKKLKKFSRMSIADLKQKVIRPELVEMHDVTAKDPVLLLHLKATRNTVPVPRHWCFKRKYLQGKRGIEKPPFHLPDFIKKTGIMEMRQALQEKEEAKSLKSKIRERVRPKLGKIDIDYQKLHDAFFKWQTKPKMTIHGDLYYEGKEFETRLKEKRPGDLSEELRIALGMPTGPNAHKCPPPWLIAMQRYGPPPSYPNLKIPGLNAPIPEGCSFGYHAGGWGKPPVDEFGRPLYGDVFGTQLANNQPNIQEEEFDRTLWGEMESESSEEEMDADESEGEQAKEDETGLVTPAEGLITPSGFSSIATGMETPDMIELRKKKIEAEMEGGDTPAALYTVLTEKKTEKLGAAMMASTHIYDMSQVAPATSKPKPGPPGFVPNQGVEVALDPSELEMDNATMTARYDQTIREQQSQLEKEDLSDMVAEHAARQKNKRKKQTQIDSNKAKRYKEFKF